MKKRPTINTKQRPNGIWDCYTTCNGYDISFQGNTMEEARQKMLDYLPRLFEWADPVIHPPAVKEETPFLTPIIGYRKSRLDTGMV